MKQHITVEQLNELSPRAYDKWLDFLPITKRFNSISNASEESTIGQMIEFLDEQLKVDWSIHSGKNLLFFASSTKKGLYGKTPENRDGELCDGLWEQVKEVLEK